MRAVGICHTDMVMRDQLVPVPQPVVLGHEGAGIVEAVGEGVDKQRVGERVWIWNAQWQRPHGTASEFIVLPTTQAVKLPDNTDFAAGA